MFLDLLPVKSARLYSDWVPLAVIVGFRAFNPFVTVLKPTTSTAMMHLQQMGFSNQQTTHYTR